MKKAQTAAEFLIIIGAAILIFTSIMFVLREKISEKTIEERNLEIEKIALAVQEEINLASSASNGYQRVFNIPEKILGMDYTINITESHVYLVTADGKNSLALPIPESNGQLVKGANSIQKSNSTIFVN